MIWLVLFTPGGNLLGSAIFRECGARAFSDSIKVRGDRAARAACYAAGHHEAEAKKKQFDAEKIAALLNKVPDKGAPRPSVPLEEQAKALTKAPVLGAPEGRDRQVSASELAILAQRIRQCVQSKWNLLAGGEQAQHTLVKLRLRFNPDGTLAGAPVIMNPQSTPYFLAVSDSAIRAAQACEPYSLPPEKYELWKDIVLNFDPRDMF
jgi:hypothetical protein